MNKKTISKICVDVVMFVLFLLLMSEFLLKEAHLWIGIASVVLFLLHNALNRRWYKGLFKGKYTAARVIRTAVDFMLWITLICCIVSGILISPDVFVWYESGVKMHLATSAWAFILMSVHLGLHWNIFVGIAKKASIPDKARAVLKWFFRVIVLAICAYGIYIFVERSFWEETFLLIDYQKEYDYSKSAAVYFFESAALSAVFVGLAYYIQKLCFTIRGKIKRR